MIPTAPQIGFDRFIQLDWVAAALKVRAGVASLDELNELLDAAGLGNEAKIKTRTKLNPSRMLPASPGDRPSQRIRTSERSQSSPAA
jgi:hypothetical protein